MEVKPGYKQTEVGVIPEDWDVVSLGNFVNYIKGYAFCSNDYRSDGIRVLRVSDTTYDSIKSDDSVYIDNHKSKIFSKWALKEHDLVISTVGSKPPMYDSLVGRAVIIGKEHEGCLLNQNAVILRSNDTNPKSQVLLLNHLRTKQYLLHIESIFRGNANQASITLKDLFNFHFPISRNNSEKMAIATALSDSDARISSMDKVIAKKRDIKQAAMQELLTGMRRLPGFTGTFEVKRLGDISAIKTGKRNNEDKIEDGNYPFFVRSQTIERINTYSYNGEAILIPGEGGIGSIIHYINGKFDYHQRVYKISDFSSDIWGKFVYYCMHLSFNKQATRNSVKATVDSLRLPTFQEFEFLAPQLQEQRAIATVLSDMDAEIAALEQQRDKMKNIKQGMMQELLTGRIRLI